MMPILLGNGAICAENHKITENHLLLYFESFCGFRSNCVNFTHLIMMFHISKVIMFYLLSSRLLGESLSLYFPVTICESKRLPINSCATAWRTLSCDKPFFHPPKDKIAPSRNAPASNGSLTPCRGVNSLNCIL